MTAARVTVGIPTFARGGRVAEALDRVLSCQPPPSEVIVHVDHSDGSLEDRLAPAFPSVRFLSSRSRVGPGGGRHRCLQVATQPIFCSFDDDSWPVDPDYFVRVEGHFANHPEAACLAAIICHRDQELPARMKKEEEITDYVGCGYAIRTDVYRRLPGHLDREVPYGFEERDMSLQLAGANYRIVECADLVVYHDTLLLHHNDPGITAGTIQNAVLLPWLRYPTSLWPYAALQLANVVRFVLSQRRFAGVVAGLIGIPRVLWKFRGRRSPVSAATVRTYLRNRRRIAW